MVYPPSLLNFNRFQVYSLWDQGLRNIIKMIYILILGNEMACFMKVNNSKMFFLPFSSVNLKVTLSSV